MEEGSCISRLCILEFVGPTTFHVIISHQIQCIFFQYF